MILQLALPIHVGLHLIMPRKNGQLVKRHYPVCKTFFHFREQPEILRMFPDSAIVDFNIPVEIPVQLFGISIFTASLPLGPICREVMSPLRGGMRAILIELTVRIIEVGSKLNSGIEAILWR